MNGRKITSMVIDMFVSVYENAHRPDTSKIFYLVFDSYKMTLLILNELEEATLQDYEYVVRKMKYYVKNAPREIIPEDVLEEVDIFFNIENSDRYALALFNSRSK